MNKEIKGAFEQLLKATAIGDVLDYDYAVFQRTGEREITLTARIYKPGMATDEDIAFFRKSVESIGWTFIIADNVRHISMSRMSIKGSIQSAMVHTFLFRAIKCLRK